MTEFAATKRPVTIRAFRLTDTNGAEVVRWIKENGGQAFMRGGPKGGSIDASVIVETLEGNMEGRPGWVFIQGVNGEFYPCDPDIFEKTYDYKRVSS